jgi:phosphoserine phosphatase
VLAALRFLNKQIFIISGGLAEPVRGFGRRLGVPPENIRAVELEYNELSGEWWRYHDPRTRAGQTYMDYDESPLTISSGKPDVVHELAGARSGRRLMIGDGVSDLAARAVVDLFVGFGGVVARDKVKSGAEAFVSSASLAPILPIAAGPAGYARVIDTPHQAVFDKGIALALGGGLQLRNDDLNASFKKAFAP